jgi:hypothetical protein
MATQITHPHVRLMGETIDVGGNVNVQNVPNNLSSALEALDKYAIYWDNHANFKM